MVPIGTVIARIQTSANQPAVASAPAPPTPPVTQQTIATATATATQKPITIGGNRFYSPLVLNIAASEGISMSELEKIPGSGGEGRVTKKRHFTIRCHQNTASECSLSRNIHSIDSCTAFSSCPLLTISGIKWQC